MIDTIFEFYLGPYKNGAIGRRKMIGSSGVIVGDEKCIKSEIHCLIIVE